MTEPEYQICPKCKFKSLGKFYTEARDIVLMCINAKCQHTKLGDPEERKASVKAAFDKYLQERYGKK